jgi:hypothetical protein
VTKELEELSALLRRGIRSSSPKPGAGGQVASVAQYVEHVIGPVMGDYVKESRNATTKLSAQIEHLTRRLELLDVRVRAAKGEPRAEKPNSQFGDGGLPVATCGETVRETPPDLPGSPARAPVCTGQARPPPALR